MDFSELYERYARDVFRFSFYLSGNRPLAEDLTSETFARALVSRDELRAGTVKAYLFTIARNLHQDAWRRQRRLVPLADDAPEAPDPTPSALTALGDRRALARVLQALHELPDEQREALVLAVDEELSHAEIAGIVGCSVAAVKVRIHRARHKLREVLDRKESCR